MMVKSKCVSGVSIKIDQTTNRFTLGNKLIDSQRIPVETLVSRPNDTAQFSFMIVK